MDLFKSDSSKVDEHLFETGEWADCHFSVGSEERIFNVHKLYLAMSSPVFADMFFNDQLEKLDKRNPIPVPVIQPEAFEEVLRYIYTGELRKRSIKIYCDILYAAQEYKIMKLQQKTIRYIMRLVTKDNVGYVYNYIVVRKLKSVTATLVSTCEEIIQCNPIEALNNHINELDIETMVKILSMDLAVENELELCELVDRFALAQEKLPQASQDGAVASVNAAQPTLLDVVKRLRLLTLSEGELSGLSEALLPRPLAATVREFARDPARLPAGFCAATTPRATLVALQPLTASAIKYWEIHHPSKYHLKKVFEDTSISETLLSFNIKSIASATFVITQPFLLRNIPLKIILHFSDGFYKVLLKSGGISGADAYEASGSIVFHTKKLTEERNDVRHVSYKAIFSNGVAVLMEKWCSQNYITIEFYMRLSAI